MASYEYRCRTCGDQFEVRRPISAPAPVATSCPAGHPETTRVFSAVAVTGLSGGGSALSAPPAPVAAGGGGCCGGGCCN